MEFPNAVVFDFDGVIRHFDPAVMADIERRHGVSGDELRAVAFDEPLGLQAVTGEITRAEWIEAIGSMTNAPEAVAEWLGYGGFVDHEMLRLIDELRAAGAVVALLTNGTDTIPAELARHDLSDTFDVVFNSADLGVAKPDPAIYQQVIEALALEPAQIFFTDDRPGNVGAAEALGIQAHLFDGIATLRQGLAR